MNICNCMILDMKIFRMRFHRGALAFGALGLGHNLLHAVFTFYYVKVFIDIFHIPERWFHIVQVIFMIWNALNDPLFGYCQDHCKLSIVKSRRHTILYGAPIFALSFLVPWFAWREYTQEDWLCAIHLLFALSFYDTMFTYVLLAGGCLVAEMSDNHEDRLRMIQYNNVATLIGTSIGIYICELLSQHLQDYTAFQITTIFIAVFAWLALTYTGLTAKTKYDISEMTVEKGDLGSSHHSESSSNTDGFTDRSTEYGILTLTWQILSNRNFLSFVVMNFLSEFHMNYSANFCTITTDILVPKEFLSVHSWSIYYTLTVALPKIVPICYRSVLSRHGYYKIHKLLFYLKIGGGVIMYIFGPTFSNIFLLYQIIDRVATFTIGSMLILAISDVIDDDAVKYNRRHPMSSMVLGTNALVTKPAISLAPMLAVAFLNHFGYDKYKKGELQDAADLESTMFAMACLLPACLGVLQHAAWLKYNIRGSHLHDPVRPQSVKHV